MRYLVVLFIQIFHSTSKMKTKKKGQEVASYWYSTVRRYNYFKDVRLLHTNVNAGHFTQMVWLKTKLFGIGKATSQTGKIFVVAFYYPPGECCCCCINFGKILHSKLDSMYESCCFFSIHAASASKLCTIQPNNQFMDRKTFTFFFNISIMSMLRLFFVYDFNTMTLQS